MWNIIYYFQCRLCWLRCIKNFIIIFTILILNLLGNISWFPLVLVQHAVQFALLYLAQETSRLLLLLIKMKFRFIFNQITKLTKQFGNGNDESIHHSEHPGNFVTFNFREIFTLIIVGQLTFRYTSTKTSTHTWYSIVINFVSSF